MNSKSITRLLAAEAVNKSNTSKQVQPDISAHLQIPQSTRLITFPHPSLRHGNTIPDITMRIKTIGRSHPREAATFAEWTKWLLDRNTDDTEYIREIEQKLLERFPEYHTKIFGSGVTGFFNCLLIRQALRDQKTISKLSESDQQIARSMVEKLIQIDEISPGLGSRVINTIISIMLVVDPLQKYNEMIHDTENAREQYELYKTAAFGITKMNKRRSYKRKSYKRRSYKRNKKSYKKSRKSRK
jgi:hypothetical protein